ncbi:MAG TPA: hypothetical protein VE779_03870, partial [Candidatus Angelobacter sp.]|nr:hypothetical protein [Candidatus Angelobacter sp.]
MPTSRDKITAKLALYDWGVGVHIFGISKSAGTVTQSGALNSKQHRASSLPFFGPFQLYSAMP